MQYITYVASIHNTALCRFGGHNLIEPATFRLVVQCLNQPRYRVPPISTQPVTNILKLDGTTMALVLIF